MADVKASKTNVSARQVAKSKVHNCKNCGNPVEVVLRVTPTGRKKLTRLCCEIV